MFGEYFAACLLALILHEGGHLAAAKWLGVRIQRIGFGIWGPYIIRDSGTRKQNILITLAGPSANLATAALVLLLSACGWHFGGAAFFVTNLMATSIILGVYNMLPIPKSDGLRALKLLLSA